MSDFYRRPTPPSDLSAQDLFPSGTQPEGSVPCSEAFVKYLGFRDQLLAVRVKNEMYYSRDEDPIIDEMDHLWSNLDDGELEYVWAQGSWRFSPPTESKPDA